MVTGVPKGTDRYFHVSMQFFDRCGWNVDLAAQLRSLGILITSSEEGSAYLIENQTGREGVTRGILARAPAGQEAGKRRRANMEGDEEEVEDDSDGDDDDAVGEDWDFTLGKY